MRLSAVADLACNPTPALFHGVRIERFTVPEAEFIRATLSRIPYQLLKFVRRIVSSDLGAKNGEYIPETQTVLFNPRCLQSQLKFDGIRLDELSLVHEVGHSIYENLDPIQEVQWESLSNWNEGQPDGNASPYVESRPGWEPFTSPWTHKAGIKLPRDYSSKAPWEQFSDCFAYYILSKPYEMSDEQRLFIKGIINERVTVYPGGALIEAGGAGSGCKGPSCGRKKKLSDRAQRAKDSYKPATKEKNQLARYNEGLIAKALGGDAWQTKNSATFDVHMSSRRIAIECKTIIEAEGDKDFTVHPPSKQLKWEEALRLKVTPYMVIFDMRPGKEGLYYKIGARGYRVASMTKAKDLKSLVSNLVHRPQSEWFGPDEAAWLKDRQAKKAKAGH